MEVGQIAKHENRFEAAAYWYRLDRRRPTRITPSKSREKLDRIREHRRTLVVVSLAAQRTSFGTRGSQVQILPLRPILSSTSNPLRQSIRQNMAGRM
jgi:hypothetical protein